MGSVQCEFSHPKKKMHSFASVDRNKGYFELLLHTLKVLECCFSSIVQRDMAWGFQMSNFSSSYLKGLQNWLAWLETDWGNSTILDL